MSELILTKPIEGHDGKITKLALREPTGGDIMNYGFPYNVQPPLAEGDRPTFELNEKIALKIGVAICDADEGVISQMNPGDLFNLMWKVVEMTSPNAVGGKH
ncbi:MAG: phage tail assembly protein [Fimbriimonadaceae bacterium]|nr:phage tail assembly protein [Alphaproteobacteria bacterium]